jgi:hypothetical protein
VICTRFGVLRCIWLRRVSSTETPNPDTPEQLKLLEQAKHLATQTTAANQTAIATFSALLVADAINRCRAQISQAISSHR